MSNPIFFAKKLLPPLKSRRKTPIVKAVKRYKYNWVAAQIRKTSKRRAKTWAQANGLKVGHVISVAVDSYIDQQEQEKKAS